MRRTRKAMAAVVTAAAAFAAPGGAVPSALAAPAVRRGDLDHPTRSVLPVLGAV
jgi:hypothetical protein